LARTVLLADDSVTAQNMGRRILTDAGYEVITVNNGSAALKKIHESRPDLIVLDVYMPGYGGLEVCQRLKESAETMRIPILLSVGKMEPFKADEAKRVRADGHIVKPFEASELLAALTRLEDRIVPQPEPSRGRKGKPEKKARSWHVASDPAQVPEEWSDKIAHLASTKERLVNREPDPETAPVETVASPPRKQIQKLEISEPAPEMPVVASTEPTIDEQELPGSDVTPLEQSFAAEEHSAAVEEKLAESEAVAEAESAPQEPPAVIDSSSAEAPESVAAAEGEIQPPAIEPASDDAPAHGLEALHAAVAEVVAQNVPTAASRWIAENVALSAEEAALELEQEMQQAQLQSASVADVPAIEATNPPTEEPVPAESRTDAPRDIEPEEHKGATFAAAASASSSAVAAVRNSAPEDESGASGPDAAAAWQNWQQIRDSVMTPQSASALAESVAQVAKAVVPESATATASETADDPSAVSSIESEVLASIVDSVLAELKPRLMQEIAKKLKK
jgi:CheY-like chemotaxis protein